MPGLNSNDPLPLLAAIGQPVGDNMGGVQEIFVLPQAALLSDPLRAGSAVVGALALAIGAVWYPLRAVLDTAGFDQSFAEDRAGGLYTGTLAGFVAEDTPELAAALLCYRNVRLLLLYRDHNGRVKLAGDTASWFTLSYRLETTQTAGGRNGYSLEFTGSTRRPALFYSAPFLVSAPGSSASGGVVEVYNRKGRLLATVPAGHRLILTSPFRQTFIIQ